jgi:hypothetical protein
MAGFRIVIDRNAEAIGAELGRISDRLGPAGMRSVYAQIGHYFERVTDQRFATETDPSGRPWAPLSEVTKAKKAKGAARILRPIQARRANPVGRYPGPRDARHQRRRPRGDPRHLP